MSKFVHVTIMDLPRCNFHSYIIIDIHITGTGPVGGGCAIRFPKISVADGEDILTQIQL